jgi:hypothetical protein
MLHDTLITRTWVVRGAILWFLARLVISAVIAAAHHNPFAISARSSAIIILVATALGYVQTARLREGVLLGNLGVSRAELSAFFALPALVGELLIAVAHVVLA